MGSSILGARPATSRQVASAGEGSGQPGSVGQRAQTHNIVVQSQGCRCWPNIMLTNISNSKLTTALDTINDILEQYGVDQIVHKCKIEDINEKFLPNVHKMKLESPEGLELR